MKPRTIAPLLIAAIALGIAVPLDAHGSGDDAGELRRQLADRYDLEVEAPDRWSNADLNSVLRGAESVPVELWDTVDEPVVLEYVDQPCLFSMGRYNERCPTFGDDGRRFFIYDAPPPAGEGDVERLALLSKSEQRDIQLRRAIVHLVMVYADDHFQWSDHWRWQAINGWRGGADQPLNRNPAGYSRYLGMRSAHLDFVTFAEEFFVRVEDLLLEAAPSDDGAAARLADVDYNQTLPCRQFTRRRVFDQRLAEAIPDWSEPRRALPHLDSPRCTDFEEWAREDELSGFDLWFAAARTDKMESLLGHLVLHARYDDGDHDDLVYQFGAVSDDDADIVELLMRGVLGGFPAALSQHPFQELDSFFLDYQSRDLRRYELRLTERQTRLFLERLWETKQGIRYPYLFLTRNDASLLLELLAPILDRPLETRRRTIVTAPDVLDTLARHENKELGPLLAIDPHTLGEEDSAVPHSVGPPGRHRVRLASGYEPRARRASVGFSYSLIEERIGELRHRGYDADMGLRLLGLDVAVPLQAPIYDHIHFDAVLLQYETIQGTGDPDKEGLRNRVGWGLDARAKQDWRRDLAASLEVTPSLLIPLWTGVDTLDHIILRTAVGARVDSAHGAYHPLLGGVVEFFGQVHLYGDYDNTLRFGFETGHFAGLGPEWIFDLRAGIQSRHVLSYRDQYPLTVAPFVEAVWTTRDYREDGPRHGFFSWETGARLELPF